MGCCGAPLFDPELFHRLYGETIAITGASGIGEQFIFPEFLTEKILSITSKRRDRISNCYFVRQTRSKIDSSLQVLHDDYLKGLHFFRNVQKMQNAKNDILSNCPDAHVDTIQMDLADLGADF